MLTIVRTGAGPVSTEEGGYYGNTTVADDVNQIITDNPDDMRDFPTESVYIDSATQRYVLPQNSTILVRLTLLSLS